MKTNATRSCSTPVPDAALLGTVAELMASADHGQVAAEARVLAALFGLAGLVLVGPAREKAEELRQWYSEEAALLNGLDAEAAPLRFSPVFLSTPRKP